MLSTRQLQIYRSFPLVRKPTDKKEEMRQAIFPVSHLKDSIKNFQRHALKQVLLL